MEVGEYPPPRVLEHQRNYLERENTQNGCNILITGTLKWWRRGESNDTPLLITRNLLKKRDAQNAITALCPIPMYKIMYTEIGRCGVAHRLRCYEDYCTCHACFSM